MFEFSRQQAAHLVDPLKEFLMHETKNEVSGHTQYIPGSREHEGLKIRRALLESCIQESQMIVDDNIRLLVGLPVSREFLEATIHGGPAREHDARTYAEYFLANWYPRAPLRIE